MTMITFHKNSRGQTALEYLLLLAVVAAVVFVGFKTFVPQVRVSTEGYYNQVSRVIQGGGNVVTSGCPDGLPRPENEPCPINGGWCEAYCPDPDACGPTAISKVCACPPPAFGGAYCGEGPACLAAPGSEGCSTSPFKICPRNQVKCPSCDAAMKAKCEATPPHPDCICRANPYVCGPPSEGIDLCDKECFIPARPSTGTPCRTSCPGSQPTDGTICPGSDAQVPVTVTSWNAVATQNDCASTKCTVYCSQGKEPNAATNATSCVDYFCRNEPSNATRCPGREIGSAGQTASLVNDCLAVGGSGGACEYTCDNFFHFDSGTGGASATCAANTCTGILPTSAVKCVENRSGLVVGFPPEDDMFVPGSSNMPWSNVGTPTSCSPAKCEYYICPVGTTSISHVNGCSSSGGVSSY